MISPKDGRGRTPIPQSGGGYSGNILHSNNFGELQKKFCGEKFQLDISVLATNNPLLLLSLSSPYKSAFFSHYDRKVEFGAEFMQKSRDFFTQKRQESSQLYYIKEQIWLLHFNSLLNEKLDLDDNMTGEKQSYLLTYFVNLYTSK